MVRISAIFIALCTVLIAASLGVALYFRVGLSIADSALAAIGLLAVLAIYNAVAGRKHDRTQVSNQVSSIARGSGDLARQVAEFGRRLGAMEGKVDAAVDKALSAAQPLAEEIEELSRLIGRLAGSVAEHEAALARMRSDDQAPPAVAEPLLAAPPPVAAPVVHRDQPEPPTVPVAAGKIAAFNGLDNEAIVALVRTAIDTQKIDLYLQPIVTLPQRKVRYYEALSRLNPGNGETVTAADFLPYAEAGSLLPRLDRFSIFRCVQVVRRLLLKNREVGLFCNVSAATLTGAGFPQLLEFVEANRAIAPSLVFEFSHAEVRDMGPMEHEALAALADRGFRFSMDHLADMRIEPRELTARGFRFVKASASLLLNRVGAASANIHPADFSDLLGRFGIDLIAERIESESTVVDLLDYDVRFGQGFLFSPPRAVRAEALQGVGGASATAKAEGTPAGPTGDSGSDTRAAALPSLPAPAAAAVRGGA
jgi:cyclic-di-GMP phosphodiesterase, flagellum assembly factor TipF